MRPKFTRFKLYFCRNPSNTSRSPNWLKRSLGSYIFLIDIFKSTITIKYIYTKQPTVYFFKHSKRAFSVFFIMFYTNLITYFRLIQNTIILILLVVPLTLFRGMSFLHDLNTRIQVNDAYLSIYYFCWTNIIYLPLFFLFLTIGVLQTPKTLVNKLFWSCLLLVSLIYLTEFWNNIISNTNLTVSYYAESDLNRLLTNTLNRYHPFVFYLSAVGLFYIQISSKQFVNTRLKFCNPYSFFIITIIGWTTTCLNLLALWMGSWWALQEGTWGGWWNWDSSEVFGLLVALTLLVILHFPLTILRKGFLSTKLTILNFFFLLGYIFVQLNFDLVSHNFGTKFSFFFSNNLFFLESIFYLTTLSSVLFYNHWTYRTTNLLKSKSNTELVSAFYFVRILPLVTITYSLVGGYKPLASYFLWNILQINILNSEVVWQVLNIIFFIFLWFWLSNKPISTHIIPLVALTPFVNSSSFLSLPLLSFNLLTSSLHSGIALFSCLNCLTFDITVNQLFFISPYSYYIATNSIFLNNFFSHTLDCNSLEVIDTTYSYNLSFLSTWNTSSLVNAPVLDFFQLNSSHEILKNFFRVCTSYSCVYMLLELPLILTLNTTFTYIIICVFFVMKLKKSKLS